MTVPLNHTYSQAYPTGGKSPSNCKEETPFDYEVERLREACLQKHKQGNPFVSRLLGVAVLIIAIWAAVVFESLLVGLAVFAAAGSAVSALYHKFRNSDYKDAREALARPVFRNYLQNKKAPLELHSIVQWHKRFLQSLA